jgi:UDP-N-acetylmuramyl pentapeptide synthase
MPLCLSDLATIIHGTPLFGSMPPVAGEWTPIVRIAFDSRLVEPGDLFWRLPACKWQTACSIQHALFRGAAGIVAAEELAAAWPGTYCIAVESPVVALARLVDWLDKPGENLPIEPKPEELKVLQLCRYRGLDITPPTCGRPGDERLRSCLRRAH